MTRANQIFVRFIGRKGKKTPPLTSRRVRARSWNFFAATYSAKTRRAIIWLNSVPVAQRYIGNFKFGLATQYSVRIGSKPGDRRYFRGRIACFQIFGRALSRGQISMLKKKCFRGKHLVLILNFVLTL